MSYYLARRQRRIGRRLYVAPTTASPAGNDTTGTGSRTAPYATIAKASTVATAGTTVFVAPGTYGTVSMQSASVASGTATNPIRYVSTVRWGAKIVAPAGSYAWIVGNNALVHPDHLRIIGFEISAPSSTIGINVAANDVWVIGCHVYNVHNETSADNAGGGIVLEGYYNDGSGAGYKATGNAAIGNWVHHIGHINNSLCHPIYVASPLAYVANNVVYDTGGWGIHLYHAPNGTKVINNTVFNCKGTQEGGILYGDGPELLTVTGYVANNIVRDCHIGLNESSNTSGITYLDNWVMDCDVNTSFDASPGDAGTTVIDVDPGMANYQINGTGDYHLTGESTASTTGILTDAPAEDFDQFGRARPQPGVGAFRTGEGPGAPASSRLPTKVAGAYWPQWESVYPDQIPVQVNALWLAFAINSGSTGAIYWNGVSNPALNQSTFQARVQTAREAGRCCILSIGGAFVTMSLDNSGEVAAFVASVKTLYNTWGGFDGIDWDLEAGQITAVNRQYHEAASRELKDFYGSEFAISMSYAGTDTVYKTMAGSLDDTGDLDWAAIQYYGYASPVTADVTTRIGEMVTTYGVDPSHLGIGVKHDPADPTTTWTYSAMVNMWNTIEAAYPTIRGMVQWETTLDRANSGGFANSVAPIITS